MKKILTLLLAALGLNTACSQNFENYGLKEFAEHVQEINFPNILTKFDPEIDFVTKI